jgi:hypothetical protein
VYGSVLLTEYSAYFLIWSGYTGKHVNYFSQNCVLECEIYLILFSVCVTTCCYVFETRSCWIILLQKNSKV